MSRPLYELPPRIRRETRAAGYLDWLRESRGLSLPGWEELWRWSVTDPEGFWGSLWDHFGIGSRAPYDCVLADPRMPGAVWFPGVRINYAEHCLGDAEDAQRTAVLARSETRGPVRLSYADLRDQVARAREGLRRLGVGKGDRVVSCLPNIPEAVVAYLATASLGAVWASCAPEFGVPSVIDRFGQLEPKVLLAVPGYVYGGKQIDRRAEVARIRAALPSVERVVDVPYGPGTLPDAVGWDALLADSGPLVFEPVPFDHPLCVLFSSGTTGKPKAIVHGHGGILLEHLKSLALHWDLRAG